MINGCQTPDDLLPSVANTGLNSVTAYFTDANGNILDDNNGKFTVTVTAGNNNIVIPIPYYYPAESDNQVTPAMLSSMRMQAALDNNVTVEPALLYMDLNQPNVITVTTQLKERVQYTITSEIRRSSACALTEFILPLAGDATLTGVVTENTKTISFLTPDVLVPCTASITISPHATIVPDPRTTTLDYNDPQRFVVTAHDGTAATYTTEKRLPAKLPKGIRVESARLLFVKTAAEMGVNTANCGGMAVAGDRIVLSTRTNTSKVINAFTGAQMADLDVTHTAAGLTSFYNTADISGNVLMSDLYNTGSTGTFMMWRIDPVAGTISNYITWTAAPRQIGRKISIYGNIDGDAIITAPFHGTDDHTFARWQVIGGNLVSQTPDVVTIIGDFLWANYACDIVYTSASNLQGDYFAAGYKSGGVTSSNKLVRVSGATNAVSAALSPVTDNIVAFSVDYIEFNNAKFVTFSYGTTTTGNERVFLLDADEALAGTPSEAAIWSVTNTYGAGNANNNGTTSDIALKASADGNFLYLYYYFTNGAIVCYQFDCYDI
jgi:hypothetical protein